MCPLFPAMAIGLILTFAQQNPLTEGRAVAYLQQLPVQQIDRSLPGTPFESWVRQVAGAQAGLTWMLTDCGNSSNGSAGGDIPGCVEVNAMLPNYRKVAVVVQIGTYNKGINGQPRLLFAVIEDKGKLFNVPRLSDLPEMLRMRVIKPKRTPVKLPALPAVRVPLWFNSGRPVGEDFRWLAEAVSYQPPHIRAPAQAPTKVSDGALIGSVISRVVPEYPLLARKNRITGVVLVQVTIAEDGRVVEAVAISGPPVLRKSSEEAARKWIFKPTVLNGVPVRIQGNLTFVFSQP